MGVAIASIGALIGAIGLAGLAAPTAIVSSIDDFKSSPKKIYGWATIRALMGLVLMVGASETALPTLIRFAGAVLVLKAALVPLLGLERVISLLDWFQARPPLLVRILFVPVASFGAFLMWAALSGVTRAFVVLRWLSSREGIAERVDAAGNFGALRDMAKVGSGIVRERRFRRC